eukprot:PhM_4_TR3350/c0_g1_i1/m.552
MTTVSQLPNNSNGTNGSASQQPVGVAPISVHRQHLAKLRTELLGLCPPSEWTIHETQPEVQPVMVQPYDLTKRTATYKPNSLDDDYLQMLPVKALNRMDLSYLLNPLHIPQGNPTKRPLPDDLEKLLDVEWDKAEKEVKEVFLWEPVYTELNGTVNGPSPARTRASATFTEGVTPGRSTAAMLMGTPAQTEPRLSTADSMAEANDPWPTRQDWVDALNKTFQRAAGVDKEWRSYLAHVAVHELMLKPTETDVAASYLWHRRQLNKEQQALLKQLVLGTVDMETAAPHLPSNCIDWMMNTFLGAAKDPAPPSAADRGFAFRNLRNPSAPRATPVSVLPVHVNPDADLSVVLRVLAPQLYPIQRMLEGEQFVSVESENGTDMYTAKKRVISVDNGMTLFGTHTVTDLRPFKQNKYATFEVVSGSHVVVQNVPSVVEAVHHCNRIKKDMESSIVLADDLPAVAMPSEQPAEREVRGDVVVAGDASPEVQAPDVTVSVRGEEDTA